VTKLRVILFGMISGVTVAGLAGYVLLEALDRPTSSYVVMLVPLIGTLLTAAGLSYGQGKTAEAVAEVSRKSDAIGTLVNGNTSKLLAIAVKNAGLSDEDYDKIKAAIAAVPTIEDRPRP
jgi:hypothetical protein